MTALEARGKTIPSGSGQLREVGVAAVLSTVLRAGGASGGGGVRLLAGVSRGGGTGERAGSETTRLS